METSDELKSVFDDLTNKAYNADYHYYYIKQTHQVIRHHFEQLQKENAVLKKLFMSALSTHQYDLAKKQLINEYNKLSSDE